MFAYCGNNPVNNTDLGGFLWAKVLIGAATNVISSAIGALVTGQEYTLADACLAAISGGVGGFLDDARVVSTLINGIGTVVISLIRGESFCDSLFYGAVSAVSTYFSPSNLLSKYISKDTMAQVAVDLTFGTAASCASSLITKIYNENTRQNSSRDKNHSALQTAQHSHQLSNLRIVNGQPVWFDKNASYPYRYENRVYCYVQF